MIGFLSYLVSKGFTPYRKIGDKYVKCSLDNYFSSTMPGYLDIRLIKGKKEVIYGLHERNHPPTLIYPRPQWVVHDYEMDRLFQTTSFEDIYNLLHF